MIGVSDDVVEGRIVDGKLRVTVRDCIQNVTRKELEFACGLPGFAA